MYVNDKLVHSFAAAAAAVGCMHEFAGHNHQLAGYLYLRFSSVVTRIQKIKFDAIGGRERERKKERNGGGNKKNNSVFSINKTKCVITFAL